MIIIPKVKRYFHFLSDKYLLVIKCDTFLAPGSSSRRKLKLNAVPSENLPVSAVPASKAKVGVSSRSLRISERNAKNETPSETCSCSNEIEDRSNYTSDEMEATEGLLQLLKEQPNYDGPKSYRDFEVQVNTPKISTLSDLLTTDSAVSSFTGICSLKLLETIVEAVQCHYIDERSHRLSIKERVVLLFTKLKCDLSYRTLSVLFGISEELCKNYFCGLLPVLSKILSHTIRLPSSEEIKQNMPVCFQQFQNVRIVIDCTEICEMGPC